MRIRVLDEAMPAGSFAEGPRVQRGQHADGTAQHSVHVRRLFRRSNQRSRPGKAARFPASRHTHAITAAGSDRPAGALR